MAKNTSLKKYTVITMATAAAVASVAPVTASAEDTTSFSDVTEKNMPDQDMREAIMTLADQEVVKGYADGTFKPYEPVYRGQMAQIMTLGLDLSIPDNVVEVNSQYNDANKFEENASYIAAVTDMDIFHGDNGEFSTWKPITREQFATVIKRYLTSNNIEPKENVAIDLDHVSPSHEDGVQYLADLGITTALDNFRPSENVTRAQLATFFVRALDTMNDKADNFKITDKVIADDNELTLTFNKNIDESTFDEDTFEIKDGSSTADVTIDNTTAKDNELIVKLNNTDDLDFSDLVVTSLFIEDEDGQKLVLPDDGVDIKKAKKHDDAVDDNNKAKKKMKELPIEEIEVEVEYADGKDYEAEIEHKSDGTYTSELEDEVNEAYIKGQAAFDKLYPMIEKLDITPDSGKQKVLNQVLSAFDLDKNYEEIEVEIDFHDSDDELEYEDK